MILSLSLEMRRRKPWVASSWREYKRSSHLTTSDGEDIYFGPRNALLAMDVEFRHDLTAGEIATAVDRLEERIRHDEPDVKHIYIEAESL